MFDTLESWVKAARLKLIGRGAAAKGCVACGYLRAHFPLHPGPKAAAQHSGSWGKAWTRWVRNEPDSLLGACSLRERFRREREEVPCTL